MLRTATKYRFTWVDRFYMILLKGGQTDLQATPENMTFLKVIWGAAVL